MRLLVSLSLAACLLLYGAGARATPPTGGSEAALRAEAGRARTWRYVWAGVNGGLTVGAFVALPLDDREARPDWIVSGVGSGITVLACWFFPLRVESAVDELDALPLAERARQLPRLYRESADDEQSRVTWPWHVANVGLSALGGGIIAFGYDHYLSGAITAGVGAALGEAQLFTQPTGLGQGQAARLPLPRLGFTPRIGRATAVWTLSLTGVL
jgi:hypothetical protein